MLNKKYEVQQMKISQIIYIVITKKPPITSPIQLNMNVTQWHTAKDIKNGLNASPPGFPANEKQHPHTYVKGTAKRITT